MSETTHMRSLGRQRTRILKKLAAIDAELRAAIVEADKAGVPKTDVAKAAGVTRQTVYNILAASEEGATP